MVYLHHYQSPLGPMTMAADDQGLTGLWFDGQKYDRAGLNGGEETGELPVFAEAERWLDLYFRGVQPDFTPELHLQGTSFRRLVWSLLLEIPFGETVTYGGLAAKAAERLGKQTMSAQAVGGAVGHNPISVIVPCHRVVGADSSLTGYAGGVERKLALLKLEGVPDGQLVIPQKGTAL